MGPQVETVAPDTSLPAEVDVVVIGGGIIGVSTAIYLSEKGLRVALCEKGHIAGEQSSRNWGWVRVTHRDMREFELAIESLKLWRTLDEKLGIQTGFNQCGILYMSGNDEKMAEHRAWLHKARELAGDAFDTREVDSKTVASLLPGASKSFVGGLYTPGDGRAEPQRAAPAMANALRRRGVKVTTVTPYYIDTGMFAGVRSPLLPLARGLMTQRMFDVVVGRGLGVYKTMDEFVGRGAGGRG